MTRSQPTKNEADATSALLTHLTKNNHIIEIHREIQDRPDMAFVLNGWRTGCECVSIPPSRIYKYVHTRFKQLERGGARAVKVLWPVEPHTWVEEVIADKNRKANAYRNNIQAEKLWLLIQANSFGDRPMVDINSPSVRQLIRYATTKKKHSFDEIYFYSDTSGIEKIYPLDEVVTGFTMNFDRGYATESFVLSTGSFSTTEEGAERKTYEDILEPELIVIQPTDPEYRKHKPILGPTKYLHKVDAGTTDANISLTAIE